MKGVCAVMVMVMVVVMGAASGHDWGLGICPYTSPFPDFDVDKFLGVWYVIQQTDTTSSCLTMNYTRATPTQLRATKSRQLLVLDSLSIEHTNSYTAKIDIPDFEYSAAMRVKWPLNLAGKADYMVLDTDYDTYAVVFECQKWTRFFHRKSVTLLSRKPTLPHDIISKERKLVNDLGISTHDMDIIDHSVCIKRQDSGFNIDIDEETIKEMLKDASQSVKDIASQVAGGASDLASSLAEVARSLPVKAQDSDVEVIE